MRHASVTVAGQELNSVLVDLPCIIECQKTLDNITLYKSGDISQVWPRCILETFLISSACNTTGESAGKAGLATV